MPDGGRTDPSTCRPPTSSPPTRRALGSKTHTSGETGVGGRAASSPLVVASETRRGPGQRSRARERCPANERPSVLFVLCDVAGKPEELVLAVTSGCNLGQRIGRILFEQVRVVVEPEQVERASYSSAAGPDFLAAVAVGPRHEHPPISKDPGTPDATPSKPRRTPPVGTREARLPKPSVPSSRRASLLKSTSDASRGRCSQVADATARRARQPARHAWQTQRKRNAVL